MSNSFANRSAALMLYRDTIPKGFAWQLLKQATMRAFKATLRAKPFGFGLGIAGGREPISLGFYIEPFSIETVQLTSMYFLHVRLKLLGIYLAFEFSFIKGWPDPEIEAKLAEVDAQLVSAVKAKSAAQEETGIKGTF